jgi:hypothetical protein
MSQGKVESLVESDRCLELDLTSEGSSTVVDISFSYVWISQSKFNDLTLLSYGSKSKS